MTRLLLVFASLCLLLLSAAPANALIAMYVEGRNQGHIQGDLTFDEEVDNIDVESFSSSVYSPYDPSTGLPSGRLTHYPIQITKAFDKATVPLTEAMIKGERLDRVTIRLWAVAVHYYTIDLVRAFLVNLDQFGIATEAPTESWGFTFETITWTDEVTRRSVTDTWTDIAAAVLPPGPSPNLALLPPLPNPTAAETMIRFDLPVASQATLGIYNVRGRRVANLFDQRTSRDRTVVRWDGRDISGEKVSNGLYLVKLKWPEGEVTQRVTLIR